MPPKRKIETEEAAEPSGRPSRAAKAAKTDTKKDAKDTKSKEKITKGKKGPSLSKDEFKAAALPLHVNIMHTPPPIDQIPAANETPGYLGHVVLTPNEFSTRSYGWKGSKKLLVQLENADGPDKPKVWVQLNINATVLGSKPTDEDEDEKTAADEPSGSAAAGPEA